jgi:hypothetical protein
VPEALLTQILPTPSEAKQADEISRLLFSALVSDRCEIQAFKR